MNKKNKIIIATIFVILIIAIIVVVAILVNYNKAQNQIQEKINIWDELHSTKDINDSLKVLNLFHNEENSDTIWNLKFNVPNNKYSGYDKSRSFNGNHPAIFLFKPCFINFTFYNRTSEPAKQKYATYENDTYKGYTISTHTLSYYIEIYKFIEKDYCFSIEIRKSNIQDKLEKYQDLMYELIDSVELYKYSKSDFEDESYWFIYPDEQIKIEYLYLNCGKLSVDNKFELDFTGSIISTFNSDLSDWSKDAEYILKLDFIDIFYFKNNTQKLDTFLTDKCKPVENYSINGIDFKLYKDKTGSSNYLIYEATNEKYVFKLSNVAELEKILINKNPIDTKPENNKTEENEPETHTIENINYTILNKSQMLDWNSISVKGKGLQKIGKKEDSPLVNNFSTTFDSKASEVLEKYPNGNLGDTIYLGGLDDEGKYYAGSNVQLKIDKSKDLITDLKLNIYTSDEFYLNDIQLSGLKFSQVKEILGDPYFTIDYTASGGNKYYVYKFNGGYIILDFLIKIQNIEIVREGYSSRLRLVDDIMKEISK